MDAEIQIVKKDQKACISSLESIILSENRNTEILHKSFQGQADKQNIRAFSWKLFLEVLPKDSSIAQWINIVSKQRAEYKQKKSKFLSTKKLAGDPLGANSKQSTSTTEPGWNSFFDDKNIKEMINKDLVRTFQEMDLFHQSSTSLILSNVLFIWSKENMDLSYKQGMNELLAIIYLTFYPYYFKKTSTATAEELISKATESAQKHSSELYQFFHDEDELQADLYVAFSQLMRKGMKDLYINKINNTSDERAKVIARYQLFTSDWLDSEDKDIPTPIYIRASLIIKEKLRAIDDEVCCHLKYIKLDPYAILQRWMKCLFMREFSYTDCFFIWDAILANQEPNDKYDLMFIDYLSIAMIVRLREKLLQGDENECLTLLFKYEHVEDLFELIHIADRIKLAINNKISGKQIKLSDVLPNAFCKSQTQSTTSTETTSNQYNTPYMPQSSQSQSQSQSQAQSQAQSSYNPIRSSGMSQFQSDPTPEPEQNQMKFLFNNAWSTVGGFVTDLKSQVSKQIDKVITDDRFNLRQQPQATSYPVNITQPSEALRILEKIYSLYQLKMDQSDQADFAAAIEYFKSNN